MFNRVIQIFREKIRTNQYIMTLHAEEEMNDDDLSVFDIERCVLNGGISGRNRDSKTGEWKYSIIGKSMTGVDIGIVSKISATGKMVIITTYKL